MAKNMQKIQVRLSPEDLYEYKKLEFKFCSLENFVSYLVKVCDEAEDTSKLNESFQYYSDKLLSAMEDFRKYEEEMVFKYAANVPSHISSETLNYQIDYINQVIIFTYEI